MQRVAIPEMEAAKLILALGPSLIPGLGQETARLMLAHAWGLELNQGKGAFNHNIGNIMAAGIKKDGTEHFYWKGDYWRPPWFKDKTHAHHKPMLDGKQPSAFRSHASYKEGMTDYLKHINRKMREQAITGRAADFAQGVWDSRYCRDNACQPAVLTRSLKRFADEFRKKGYFESLPSTVSLSKNTGLVAGAAVIAVAGGIFFMTMRKPKGAK
jgi:hypothetical protein